MGSGPGFQDRMNWNDGMEKSGWGVRGDGNDAWVWVVGGIRARLGLAQGPGDRGRPIYRTMSSIFMDDPEQEMHEGSMIWKYQMVAAGVKGNRILPLVHEV